MFYSTTNRRALPILKRVFLCCTVALVFLCGWVEQAVAAPEWSTKLDGRVRFYQATELGVMIAGTEKSLYAVDSESGDVLWRRKNAHLDETDVAPVPGTDIVLLSLEDGKRTRLEAADLMTGEALWRSDKARGQVMQMAVDLEANLLAVVFARDARGHAREGFKRRAVVHMFDLTTGRELWAHELESEIEMMPARWSEGDDDTFYTLDNYRPPVFLDNRLYLFYEGITSLDARSGKERRREKFRVNEEGLALTEADPVADEGRIYVSGRGRVRAISRASGEEVWEAKDLGLTPEMVLTPDVLYVRTGGQFTRLRDGETVERGPYGVSAIDVATGKILWRYKGADKGITNLALNGNRAILIADRDDLIMLDPLTGKRSAKISHKIERAAFVLLNERGETVVGGSNEIAAFALSDGHEVWRSRHNPPGRGLLRTIAAIAARAASLYFRFGGVASTAFRGIQLVNTLRTLRYAGLATRVALQSLSTIAVNSSRAYLRDRFATFGALARVQATAARVRQATEMRMPELRPPDVSRSDVEERLLDRLDPARQLERLSRFLLRRRRLAALRGQWMYFYTELKKGRGLAGVNINTGLPERAIRLSDPDERFISDEVTSLLYTAEDNRLLAYALNERE